MFFDIVQNDKLDNDSYSSSFYKVKLNEELLNKYQDIIKIFTISTLRKLNY